MNKKLLLLIPLVFIVGFGTNMFFPTLTENISILPSQAITKPSVSEEYFEEYKDWAHREIDKFKTFSEKQKDEKNDLNSENIKLQRKIQKLENQLANTKNQYSELYDTYLSLYEDQSEFRSDVERYLAEVEEYRKDVEEKAYQESLEFKATIKDQKVNWNFSDLAGNLYSWSMPIDTYEYFVKRPRPNDTVLLELTSTGETIRVRDMTVFVERNFKNVSDLIYENAGSDVAFVTEAWYIVSQFSTYSYDIGEYPRWSLETLTRGGGDCEDTAILLAEILRSSKYTQDWDIKFVYFDAYNPTKPQGVNHVSVVIDTGENYFVIETTANTLEGGWDAWAGISIVGWYFDV